MGQGGGDGTGVEISARAEKLCTDAVTHVFLTLCGKSDAPDKFTGMQVYNVCVHWRERDREGEGERERGREKVSVCERTSRICRALIAHSGCAA